MKDRFGHGAKFGDWIGRQGAWRRIFIFLGLLAIAWLPIALPLYWLGNAFDYSNITEILALALLYIGFLVGLPRWGRQVHHWPNPLRHCGLSGTSQTAKNLAIALVIGVLGVFALFGTETLLGWATPTAPSPRLVRFVLEGLLMALAVGFVEEMMFRGWILAELEKNYSATAALLMDAVFFASTHFIKPWAEIVRTFPQFLGLVILGMALVWARRSPQSQRSGDKRLGEKRSGGNGTLGYPIGLHAGLIWGYYIVNVGGLSEYTGRAPEWATGIDSNPLAGLLGLILLGAIASQFAKIAQPKCTAKY
jgi:uncharacterized protein